MATADAMTNVSFAKFLETTPPGKPVPIAELLFHKEADPRTMIEVKPPVLQLHCATETCRGIRFFDPQIGKSAISSYQQADVIWTYECRNCKEWKTRKTFALRLAAQGGGKAVLATKFGEMPLFGPPIPAGVITIIGGEREYFLKGYRAENQALGIAAFAYYRRVVENQKKRIIEEITRVAETLNAGQDVIEDLKRAREETQFTKAVGAIRHGIPEVLLIKGHNPLTLLHSALSEGLHAQTDEECLEIATSIRIVLTELVERMSIALKEEQGLNAAVTRLLKASADKTTKAKVDGPQAP